MLLLGMDTRDTQSTTEKEITTMGQAFEKCPTCVRPKGQPFRKYDDHGKVVNGCVDEYHTGEIFPIPSESARWHYRKEAEKIRAMTKRGRMGYGYEN
jgi:hypothetical protein